MKKENRRGFVWYPQDYFGETKLWSIPPWVRCVWLESLFLMQQSPRPGVLLKWTDRPGGAAFTLEELAVRHHGLTPAEVAQAHEMLLQSGVADRDRTTGQLTNRKMVRDEKRREIGSKFGRKGGGNPALKKSVTKAHEPKLAATFIGQDKGGLYTTEPEPEPEPDSIRGSNTVSNTPVKDFLAASGPESGETESKNEPEPPPRKVRPTDQAFEEFRAAYEQALGCPYVGRGNTKTTDGKTVSPYRGDFVWLQKIRAANHTAALDSPPGWSDAVRNYFSSPLQNYTITDLCSRFGVFKNGPVDRFGKLGGSTNEQRRQRSHEAIKRFIGEVDGRL